MTPEAIRLIGTYVLAALVLVACFIFIYSQRGDQTQAWTLAGVIVTAVIVGQAKDRAYTAGASAAQSAYPTVTTERPQSVTVQPGTPPEG